MTGQILASVLYILGMAVMVGMIAVLVIVLRKFITKNNSRFLCDTCAYDYERSCHNSQRPNVKKCPDYKRR